MRIAFLSTPDFGIPVLNALLEAGHEIVGVFTQPDRPRGRGNKLTPCPVKAEALSKGLPCFSFEKIKNDDGYETLVSVKPDVLVTAAFGQILTKRILDIAPYGCVNVHGSLLPRYRGAAPIQWSVINGEKISGITTMLTDVGVDCGPMLLKEEVAIGEEETAGELFDRLAFVGARVLVKTLEGLEKGTLTPIPQDEAQATKFPMIKKEDAKIDFDQPAEKIRNFIRGMNPAPGAYTYLPDGELIKIHKARCCEGLGRPGEILESEGMLRIACGQGALELEIVQTAGKKAMSAQDYLRGHAMKKGELLKWQ